MDSQAGIWISLERYGAGQWAWGSGWLVHRWAFSYLWRWVFQKARGPRLGVVYQMALGMSRSRFDAQEVMLRRAQDDFRQSQRLLLVLRV